MAKDIVILVHGMGTHARDNMKKEFTEGVNTTARCLLSDNSYDISQQVDLQEFNYSDELDEFLKKLEKNLKAITDKKLDQINSLGLTGDVIDVLLAFHNDFKDNFFRTHWMDVILYGTTYFGEKLRVEFARFFCSKLKQSIDTGCRLHVIAHSLGTALVHDTLSKLYRREFSMTDNIPDLPTGSFNFDSLWTFANVSRMVNLLNGLSDPLSSSVTTGPDGCANAFYNVRHKLDPFTWFKTFDRKMINSKTYENDVVRRWNTHDFQEYVSDPLVTKRLVNTLTPDFYITNSPTNQDTLSKCVSEHRKTSLNAAYEKLKVLRDTYKEKDKQYHSFREIYQVIKDIVDASKDLKDDMQ